MNAIVQWNNPFRAKAMECLSLELAQSEAVLPTFQAIRILWPPHATWERGTAWVLWTEEQQWRPVLKTQRLAPTV